MAETLHQPEPPKLADYLDRWTQWHLPEPLTQRPKLRRLIGHGTAHHIFELDTEQPLVARWPVQPEPLGMPRTTEFDTQKIAASAGLAPEPYCLDPVSGTVIQERLIPSASVVGPRDLGALIQAIQQLPELPIRLNLRQAYIRYIDTARQRGHPTHDLISADDPLLAEAFEYLDSQEKRPCHNDLTPGNVVMANGSAVAMDWEYAGMGNPCFELAAASASLSDAQRKQFFKTVHLPCTDGDCLRISTVVYNIVALAWYRAADVHTACEHTGRAWVSQLGALL